MSEDSGYWLFTHFTQGAAKCCKTANRMGKPTILLRYGKKPVGIVVPVSVVQDLLVCSRGLVTAEYPSTIFRTGDLVPIMLAFMEGPCLLTITDHKRPVGGLASYDLLEKVKKLVPGWSGTYSVRN